MRVWDLPVETLCTKHLQGEHSEIHTMWSVITRGRKGWAKHPETMRWRGRLGALKARHDAGVAELQRRGRFNHKTPLDPQLIETDGPDTWRQDRLVESVESQIANLRAKGCKCNLPWADNLTPPGR